MKEAKFFCSSACLILALFLTNLCAYAEKEKENDAAIEITPSVLFVGSVGDRDKFQEDNWTSSNTSGGISNMSISKQLNYQDSLEFEGRAIGGNNDYNADLTLSREGLGSLTIAFKEFRKYYDGTGGYFSRFTPTPAVRVYPVELDRDLHLDIGNFKIEGILAKEDSPEYSLSYERNFREGSKSLLNWGSITGADGTSRKIYPSFLEQDQVVHKVTLGVKRETKDSEMSAEQEWERIRNEQKNIYGQTLTLATGVISSVSTQYENSDSDLYSTKLRYSKELNKKVYVSCGLLYNHFKGGSLEFLEGDTNTLNPAEINQDAATILPNISFTPFKDLNLAFGSKAEFMNKNGSANNNFASATNFVNIKSEVTRKIFCQNFRLKYSGMKNAAWYGDATFEKRLVNDFERQDGFTTANNFSRKTNTTTDNNTFTVGNKWYPVSGVDIATEYKLKKLSTENQNEFLTGDVVSGYRSYMDSIELVSQTPLVKLNYKPFRWMAYKLGYIYDSTRYGIRTRASDQTMFAKYNAHIYSGEVTLSPYDYFYFTLFFQKTYAKTKTRASDWGATVNQPAYRADFNVLRLSSAYALSKNTTLEGGYSMYRADNFDDFSTTGLPLGLDNLHQDIFFGVKHNFNKDRSLELKYSFQKYDEDTMNEVDNYEAHMLSAAMRMVF